MRLSHLALAALVVVAPTLPLATLGAQGTATPKPVLKPRTTYEDLQLLSGVLNQIRTNHPDSADTHRLLMSAISAMVHAQDPHSYFIPAMRLDAEKEKAWREGKLHPIGVSFRYWQGAHVVAGVVPGSDAARQDILIGDELVAVDGQPVSAESAEELEIGLAGQKGTPVKLTLERQRSDGSTTEVVREVKRESFKDITAVPVSVMADAATGTGYVRITSFMNDKVAEDLHAAIVRLEKQGMKRLVLDLRDNGGGSVAEAARIAGEFLPEGAIVYTQEGRRKDVADTGKVSRSFWSRERRYPIVLLQNEGSASASELVSGALQDHDRALVVGRPSFGKSLVMFPFLLPDGSTFWMVAGRMKTPCGRVIQRQYRGMTTREYRRHAGQETAGEGRPSCRTKGGRVVYGGGGVYPDVVLPRTDFEPVWLARLNEEGLFMKWVAGHVSANAAYYTTADALAAKPEPAPGAVADFRKYAGTQGLVVPEGADVDVRLSREILRWVAEAKWGDAGRYRVEAATDPQVKQAVEAFGKAEAILAKQ
jgi:carboxyl-terminal processing protease